MGSTGKGFAAKICGQLYVSTLVAALPEALAFASKAGVPVREILKLWGESDFRSPLLEGFGGGERLGDRQGHRGHGMHGDQEMTGAARTGC